MICCRNPRWLSRSLATTPVVFVVDVVIVVVDTSVSNVVVVVFGVAVSVSRFVAVEVVSRSVLVVTEGGGVAATPKQLQMEDNVAGARAMRPRCLDRSGQVPG